MKIPFVKEWGSWVVFVSCCITAIMAAMRHASFEPTVRLFIGPALTALGLALLINAKNPGAAVIRSRGQNTGQLAWLLLFTSAGLALMAPFLMHGIKDLLFFALLVVIYALFLAIGREHHILAELNGFALLTLTTPLVYFSLTGELAMKLYAAVLLFFWAGVFKVRLRIRKTFFFRLAMILYCVAAGSAYVVMNISILLLLPLLENIVSAVMMREEKLRTTGYIELSKSISFILLVALFWH